MADNVFAEHVRPSDTFKSLAGTQAMADNVFAGGGSKKSDGEKLGARLTRHGARLRAHAARRLSPGLRGRVSESDIIQEVYREALERELLDKSPSERPSTVICLLNMLNLRFLQELRRHGAAGRDFRREQGFDDNRMGADGGHQARLSDSATSPSGQLIQREDTDRLMRGLDSLAVSDREILQMRWGDELPFGDIAVRLGISEGTARMRSHRAFRRLKGLLGGHDNGDA